MLDFIYNTPTKVYFGKGQEQNVGKIVSELGYKKIMMQYGKGSIFKSGLYDTVMNSLKEYGISVVEFGGVEPNPKLSFVHKAIEVARQENVEMILAVGGGSVIDSCKMTALGVKAKCDVFDFALGKAIPTQTIPVGCILTIAAAGSEMSSSAVLTDLENNIKKGTTSELNRCKFAILNPQLTFTVSKYQTACGIVDIMMHTMERYFSCCPPTELTDSIAEGLLRSVISAGKVLMDNPNDYNARATVMWASSLSHNGLTGSGRINYMPVHQLEHAVSGAYDNVAHGAGLAVLFPIWCEYVWSANPSRFASFGRNVWGVQDDNDLSAGKEGIKRMREFFDFIGMPKTLSEFGIDKSASPRLAELCTFSKTKTVDGYVVLDYDKLIDFFNRCF